MDDISVAALILGTATAGFKVSIKVVTLASQISTAADRVSSIGDDVSLTAAILHQLGDLMNRKTTDSDLPVFSKAGLESSKSSAESCQRIFEEIERATARASNVIRGRKGPMGEKVKLKKCEMKEWPVLQPSMEVWTTELREAKGTLMLMLQLASLALSKRVTDLNTCGSSDTTEQQDIIRSVLILKRQHQQNKNSNPDIDADVSEDLEKMPAETVREIEKSTTQRPPSINPTQPSGSSMPIAELPAARPATVQDLEDQPPERPKALTTETKVEVPKGFDISTADASSPTASEFVVLSRTNSYNQPLPESPLETQSLQGRSTAPAPSDVKLRLFTIHPLITIKHAQIHLSWRGLCARLPEPEIHALVAQNRASGFTSVFAFLEALHEWERNLVAESIHGFAENVTLVSLKRTSHDERHGSILLAGLPSFELVTSQPAHDPREVKLSRPTFVKVARWHCCPQTLDEYGLPWVWDDQDPDYILIERWIPECDQLILFEHTRLLRERQRRRDFPFEGEPAAEEDDSGTEYEGEKDGGAGRKGEKDEGAGTEAEEKAAVEELLGKYTTVFRSVRDVSE